MSTAVADWAKYIECPCCGDEGAEATADGYFHDGQALICGCKGHVSVGEDEDPWINNLDTCDIDHDAKPEAP